MICRVFQACSEFFSVFEKLNSSLAEDVSRGDAENIFAISENPDNAFWALNRRLFRAVDAIEVDVPASGDHEMLAEDNWWDRTW